MTALSPEQRDHFEKLLNEYEQMREDAQQGMKSVVGDLREKLGALVAKEDMADELAGFRLYVKRRYAKANHPEKVAKADAKNEIADAYEFQASGGQVYTTRTHSAGRATQAVPVPQTDPHAGYDRQTGEIIDDASLRVVALAAGLTKLAASGDADAIAVMAAAKAGPDVMRATAAAILDRDAKPEHTNAAISDELGPRSDIAAPESCGGVDRTRTDVEVGRVAPSLRAEPLAEACPSDRDPIAGIEPGPQDTFSPDNNDGGLRGIQTAPLVGTQNEALEKAIEAPARSIGSASGKSSSVAFIPDPSTPRVRNLGPEPDLPAFLKRATTGQVGRA